MASAEESRLSIGIGDIVRLVDHVGGIERCAPFLLGDDELVEYQEQLVRIDGARIQIIVAIFRVVEVKSAELAEGLQPRDDLLDIHVRRVMPEIHQA